MDADPQCSANASGHVMQILVRSSSYDLGGKSSGQVTRAWWRRLA
jgi:hypothetical protein